MTGVRLILDTRCVTIHGAECPLLVDGDDTLVPFQGLETALGEGPAWCLCLRAVVARALAGKLEREVCQATPLGDGLRKLSISLDARLALLAEGIPKPRPRPALALIRGGSSDDEPERS
jgi:hypothetical protein